jgi:hypothetical protein
VALIADRSVEQIIRDLQDSVRQLRASGGAEVSAPFTAASLAMTADSAWRDDPDVYVDVFVRNGGLRVDTSGNVTSAAGATASYAFRLYTLTDTGSGFYLETLYREAVVGEGVEVVGAVTVGASRAARVDGLPANTYRVRGATRLTAGTGSVTNRRLLAVPR